MIYARGLIIGELNTTMNEQDSVITVFKAELQGIYNSMANMNTSVTATNAIEEYEKEVNSFIFLYSDIAPANIPQGVITSLQSIAGLCPFAYGKAPYRARSFLARLGIMVDYDDKANCAALGYFREAALQSENNYPVNLFASPNPASDHLTIYLNEPADPRGNLIIYNLLGNRVLEHRIKEKAAIVGIDIAALDPVVYLIQYTSSTQKSDYVKFAVIR